MLKLLPPQSQGTEPLPGSRYHLDGTAEFVRFDRRTPWDDPAFANVSAPVHPPAPPGAAPGAATATEVPGYMAMPAVPKSVVRRRAEFEMEQAKEQYKKQLVRTMRIISPSFTPIVPVAYSSLVIST
jgi:hypothetical protein